WAKHDRIAAEPLAIRMLLEIINYSIERARQIKIVAIDISEYVARRSCQTFIDRVHLPAILITFPVSQTIFIALDYADTLVRAATVDDNVLERLTLLIKHRAHGLLEILPLIKGGRDDTQFQRHQFSSLGDLRMKLRIVSTT